MSIEGKSVLVTGANPGIGQALVTEALRRARPGVRRDAPAAGLRRRAGDTADPGRHRRERRSTPLGRGQVSDVLINDAQIALFGDWTTAPRSTSTWPSTCSAPGRDQGLLPRSPVRGDIVDDVSNDVGGPLPLTTAYTISKRPRSA